MPSAAAKRKAKAKHIDEEDSDTSLSEPSQGFVAKPNDEKDLWSVEAIVGEKPKEYKVRWAGNDPKTGKPWPDNWEPKANVTDDLVLIWKKKKKAEERKRLEAKEKKKSARASTSSRARTSFASTSRTTRSGSTATVSGAAKRERSVASNNSRVTKSTRTATPLQIAVTTRNSAAAKKSSRAHISEEDSSEDEADELQEDEEEVDEDPAPDRSAKKVKSVSAARTQRPSRTNGKKRKLSQTDFRSTGRASEAASKGKRPKDRQAASAFEDEAVILVRPAPSRSSTSEQEDFRLFGGEGHREARLEKVERYVNVYTGNGNGSGSGRAPKRRRVNRGRREELKEEEEEDEDEEHRDSKENVVEGESPPQSKALQDTQDSFEPRRGGPRKLFLEDDEERDGSDEEEERLVQETLSEGFGTPGPEILQHEEPPRSRSQSKTPPPTGTPLHSGLGGVGADEDAYMDDFDDPPPDMHFDQPLDMDIPENMLAKTTPSPTRKSVSTEKIIPSKLNPSRTSTLPPSKSKAKPVKRAASSDSDVEIISITRVDPPKVASRAKTRTTTSPTKASSSKRRPSPARQTSSHSSSSTVEVKIGPPGKRSVGYIPVSPPSLKKARSTTSSGSESGSDEEEDEPSKRPVLQVARRSANSSAKTDAKEPTNTTRPDLPRANKSSKTEPHRGTSHQRPISIKKPQVFSSAKPPTGVVPSRLGEDEGQPSGSKPISSTKSKQTLEEEDDSDTDRGPPPLEWEVGSPTKKLPRQQTAEGSITGTQEPIREKSVVYDGMDVDKLDTEPLPGQIPLDPLDEAEMTDEVLKGRLSPGARKRLRKFESEVLGLVVDKEATSGTKKGKKDKKKEKAKAKARAAAAAVAQAAEQPPARISSSKSHQHQPQHSYMTDIVPETEVEESQSQEKELQIPQPVPPPPPPPPPPSPPPIQSTTKPLDVPATPNNPSLKSRMKPRTPGSRTGSTTDMASAAADNGQPDLIGLFNANPGPSGLVNGTKVLRPIPQISPSKFHPHIQAFPSSSLPDSVIEPVSSNESRKNGAKDGIEPIEDFDSPEKKAKGKKGVGVLLDRQEREPRGRQSADDVWDSEIVQRGRRIAEDAQRKRRRTESMSSGAEEEVDGSDEVDGTRKRKKRSLKDIQERFTARSRHISEDEDVEKELVPPGHHDGAAEQVQEVGPSQETQEEDVADASTTVIPPASGPPAPTPQSQASSQPPSQPFIEGQSLSQSMSQPPVVEQSSTLREMREPSVELNGAMDVDQSLEYASPQPQELDVTMDETTNDSQGMSKANRLEVPDKAVLRQEEEESTQDLVAEMRAMEENERTNNDSRFPTHIKGKLPERSMQEVVIHVRSPEHTPEQDDGGHESDGGNWLDIPQITIEQPSRAASVRSESVLSDAGLEERRPTRPMTRSRSRSQTPTSVKSSGSKRGQGKGKGKKPLEIPSPIQSRSATPEQEEPAQAILLPTDGPSSTVLMPVLTPTQSSSGAELAEERQRNEALQQELHSMREQLKQVADQNSLLDSSNRQEVAELQSQRASEAATWEDERVALQARISSLEGAKALANKDCDFFREQYGKASGFATSVREENKELEKRIQIAEGQASKGVELVKATFELRVKTSEDNAKAWRSMAEFAMEKDRRTNDDIRRRAAEEPELRARCERQRHAIELDEERIEDLEAELIEKQSELNRANAEIIHRKTENDSLQEDLNEALIKLDRIGRQGDDLSQGDGHELLWCCKWDRASLNPCRGTFATLRDFQNHMQAHVYTSLPSV